MSVRIRKLRSSDGCLQERVTMKLSTMDRNTSNARYVAPVGALWRTFDVLPAVRTAGYHPRLLRSQSQPLDCNFSTRALSVICGVAVAFAAMSPVTVSADDDTIDHAYSEPPITDSDRDHWSLKPRQPIEVPATKSKDWQRNPIDAFIAAELETRGITPQPTADHRTLIRRVTLNLTGLPPTRDEVKAFIADESATAYQSLVDRLLASSAYGEHAAQYWLDLARFAETDGFEHDNVRPNAWRYRDWVIESFNADMPYDQFIRLQIAGDLLQPDNEAAAIATQFCVSGPDMPDINSQDERRHTLLNEMTSTVGEVVLGLQIGCAQCHDHKYDPISQADFYRLRAIFEPAINLKKNVSVAELKELQSYKLTSHVMIRGDFRRPGMEVSPNGLRVLESESLHFETSPQRDSDGRRIGLANWLTHPNNPLTARVIVNRVWQQHFGRGLSESPSDFGVMGMEPSHPQLLDWLANWLVENGWSHQAICIALIVTSATYRQRSRLPDGASVEEAETWRLALEKDPDVQWLSRFPRQRLSGEVIRDVMLSVGGKLNRKTGGPGVRPPLPAELRSTLLKDQWNVTEDTAEHDRRSIYVFARRNLRFPIFEAFDRPAANQSCSRRNVSTTAPQSLHLLNSEFSFRTAEQIAERILEGKVASEQQIETAFTRVLNRRPTTGELEDARRFIANSGDQALTQLCLALLNSNEFVFID
jgi:hypothetical protein